MEKAVKTNKLKPSKKNCIAIVFIANLTVSIYHDCVALPAIQVIFFPSFALIIYMPLFMRLK
jgi:hypothetical protein